MARGGYRPGAGRPKGAKAEARPTRSVAKPAAPVKGRKTPLEYALSVINDRNAAKDRRDRLAIAAMPYMHSRVSDGAPGKKQKAQAIAEDAASGADGDWGGDLTVPGALN